MSTTLVNVGILNGRSTKLDTDDLTVLSEIVENYSTDVMVTTPEIVIPEFDSDIESSDDLWAERGVEVRRTDSPEKAKRSSAKESSGAVDSNVKDEDVSATLAGELGNQPVVIDENALIASLGLSAQAPVSEQSLTQSVAAATVSDEIENTDLDDSIDAASRQAEQVVEHEDRMGASQIIERAKQAAIETAMLTAANTAAMASTPLLQPPKRRVEKPTKQETEKVDDSVNQSKVSAPQHVEEKTTETTNSLLNNPVRKAVDRLRRENLVVEEITSELASRMEADAFRTELPIKEVSEKSVAILAPTEKQYDRLVENLLEKTVPGMPASMMFAASEHNFRTGKVSSSVAAMLAEKDLGKVLLIDADVAEKSLTDSLIDSNEPGLIEVLNREEQIDKVIMRTGMDNLFFLPAGIATLSSEKTMAGRMAALNQQLKQSFRFVIIDGGSSSEIVCRTFSSFCESTYLVVSLGQTFCSSAAESVNELQTAGARLLGTVVTK